MKLSRSEKIILAIFLVAIVAFVGTVLFIVPAFNTIGTSMASYALKVAERESFYQALEREDTIDEDIAKAKAVASDISKYFYEEFTSDEFDVILRDILTEAGMKTDTLLIEAYTTKMLTLVDYEDIAVQYPLRDYAQIYSGASAPAATTTTSEADSTTTVLPVWQYEYDENGARITPEKSELYYAFLASQTQTVGVTSVTFTVKGKFSDYVKLLDNIKDLEKATYVINTTIPYTIQNITMDAEGNTVTTNDEIEDTDEIEVEMILDFYSVAPVEEEPAA